MKYFTFVARAIVKFIINVLQFENLFILTLKRLQ